MISLNKKDNAETASIAQEIERLIIALRQFPDSQPESQAYRLLAEKVASELMTNVQRSESYTENGLVLRFSNHSKIEGIYAIQRFYLPFSAGAKPHFLPVLGIASQKTYPPCYPCASVENSASHPEHSLLQRVCMIIGAYAHI